LSCAVLKRIQQNKKHCKYGVMKVNNLPGHTWYLKIKNMKKIILMIVIAVSSTGIYAQNKPAKNTKKNEPKQEAKYCCPKGDFCGNKPGKCTADNSPLIKGGTYYCETCNTTNDKAGKCTKCGKDMKKMENKTSAK